jgi:hypothetical protein
LQSTDFPRFHTVLLGMGELYAKPISKPMLDAYWVALRNWDLPEFEAACARLMETATWMPRPAEFTALRIAGRRTAGEAFAKAIAWARSGAYRHPAKTDEAILIDRVVAAMGGWITITSHDQEKLHFLERRFTEHYESIQDAGDVREWLQLPRDRPHELTEANTLAKRLLRELTTDTHNTRGNGSS